MYSRIRPSKLLPKSLHRRSHKEARGLNTAEDLIPFYQIGSIMACCETGTPKESWYDSSEHCTWTPIETVPSPWGEICRTHNKPDAFEISFYKQTLDPDYLSVDGVTAPVLMPRKNASYPFPGHRKISRLPRTCFSPPATHASSSKPPGDISLPRSEDPGSLVPQDSRTSPPITHPAVTTPQHHSTIRWKGKSKAG